MIALEIVGFLGVVFAIGHEMFIEDAMSLFNKTKYLQSLNAPDERIFPNEATKEFVKDYEQTFKKRLKGAKLQYAIDFYKDMKEGSKHKDKFKRWF